jgi:NAD(P)-dependent dehydrogenase (short-subunit alcohol dehydrogenase family)
MEPYNGKNAIIFGGSSGIGLATARLLQKRGAKVTIADLSPPPVHDPASSSWICCDVRDQTQVAAAVLAATGQEDLHWLVYSAGIQHYGTVLTTPIEEYDLVQAVNARGAFLAAQASIPLMKHGGSIVLVSSVQAIACQNGVAAYAASKGTLEAMMHAMAVDHAKDNVRVNTVMPGTVDTPMVRTSADSFRGDAPLEAMLQEWGSFHPMLRVAQPEEVACVIAFLLSDEASFLTGSSYRVDGGLLAQLPVRLQQKPI